MDLGDLKHLDAPAKVLKLSEAIRIGSRIRPQCFKQAFHKGGSCAWGAAWEGSGHEYNEFFNYGWALCEWWSAADAYNTAYGSSITADNDCNLLPREFIANRLEAIGL